MLAPCIDVSGLATTDRDTPGYVKFVDRITQLIDFQKAQGHEFNKIVKRSCLVICWLVGIVSCRMFDIFRAQFEGHFGL